MFFRGLFHLHCSKLQDRHFLARHEKPTLFTVFLGNTRRGNWFSSSHCQIYSRVAPLTWVKLLLISLSMGGSFALKKTAVGLVTMQRSERKRHRAGKESEFIMKWRGVGYWVKSWLCWIHKEFSLRLHFINKLLCKQRSYVQKERIYVGAVLDGFELWPWHLKLLADSTLIWQSHSNYKILGSFKLPKGRYSAVREANR